MKILVTGGKGFIGSHLVKELRKRHNVLIFDVKNKRNEDVRNLEYLLKVSKNVDVIVHLAALSVDPDSIKKPWEYLTTNILSTINVLETGRRLGIKKIIFTSSAATSSTTPYGISKLHGEQLCEIYSKLYKMNVIIVKIYNVYGEGNTKGVIKEFLERIIKNKPLIVHGKGEYVRDYIHVRDVVKTIIKFIEKNCKSGVYEVGTGIGTSLNELIEILKEVTDKKIKVKYEKCYYDRIKYSVATNTCVKNPTKLIEGLRELWRKSL